MIRITPCLQTKCDHYRPMRFHLRIGDHTIHMNKWEVIRLGQDITKMYDRLLRLIEAEHRIETKKGEQA